MGFFCPHALKFDLVLTGTRKVCSYAKARILNHNTRFCVPLFGLWVNSSKLVKQEKCQRGECSLSAQSRRRNTPQYNFDWWCWWLMMIWQWHDDGRTNGFWDTRVEINGFPLKNDMVLATLAQPFPNVDRNALLIKLAMLTPSQNFGHGFEVLHQYCCVLPLMRAIEYSLHKFGSTFLRENCQWRFIAE